MENKVYRSGLTPVSLLRRSSYMFPKKATVVYGEWRYSLQRVGAACRPPVLAAARRRTT